MVDRAVKALFSNAIGLPGVLWVIVAYIITDIPERQDGDLIMLLGSMLAGMMLQAGMYALSHRSFMNVDRSPVFVWCVVVFATTTALAVLAALSWDLYVFRHEPAQGVDSTPLVLAVSMAVLMLSSGFRSRMRLIRMRTDYRSNARVARQASRLLVPIGPFSMDRIVRTLDEMADRGGANAPLARRLDEFVDEFRVRGDSRYARCVPWASGVCVVEAYVQMRAARAVPNAASATVPPIVFERQESLEHVRLRPSLVCTLLDVLAPENESQDVSITLRSTQRDGNLVIQFRGVTLDRRRVHVATREVNMALPLGVVLDRRVMTDDTLVLELICPPGEPQSDFEWSTDCPGVEEAQLLSASRYSDGAKRNFRTNGLVVRAQRMDLLDPKPTLIEEEYLIMRRLADASPAFPRVVGCGARNNVQWLLYQFEPGMPLGQWLGQESNRRQWFRIIAEVDNMIRTMRDNCVAHRDLNPGNIIVRTDGSLALIDFDQAVADDERFLLADTNGVATGLGKNDIGLFIERCDLTRKANHAIHTLSEAWRKLLSAKTPPQTFIKSPYQFDFAGQSFPGWVPWFDEWQPISAALGDLRGKRVLNLAGGIGLLDAFLALGGAEVTTVEARPEYLEAAGAIASAAQVTVRFDPVAAQTIKPGQYDLVIAVGSGLEPAKTDWNTQILKEQSQILMEVSGPLQEARKLVEDMGWVWRGVAGYTPRLCPLVAAANPSHLQRADWVRIPAHQSESETVPA